MVPLTRTELWSTYRPHQSPSSSGMVMAVVNHFMSPHLLHMHCDQGDKGTAG